MKKLNLMFRPYHRVTDYETVKSWWEKHGWKPLPPALLPTVGQMVYDTETNKSLICGWLYLDSSSPIAMLEWVISNPENTSKESYQSLHILIKSLTELAKKLGYQIIHTSLKNENLVKIYKQYGFEECDREMVNLLWRVE